MNRSLKNFVLLLLVVMAASVLYACEKPAKVGKGDFFNIRPISLNVLDKNYLLRMARARLIGESFKELRDEHPVLYASDKRAAFLVLPRHNEFALITFGTGDGVVEAVEEAVRNMSRLAAGEDLEALPIRIDVIETTTDLRTVDISKKNRIKFPTKNRSMVGIILDTVPPIPLLPGVIIDRNVINENGNFHEHRLKNVVKDFVLGTRSYRALDDMESLDYCLFTSLSFMEDGNGGVMDLWENTPEKIEFTPVSLLASVNAAAGYLQQSIPEQGEVQVKFYPHYNKTSDTESLLKMAKGYFGSLLHYEATNAGNSLEAYKLFVRRALEKTEGPSPADIEKGVDFKAIYDHHGKRGKAASVGTTALTLSGLSLYTRLTGDKQYLPVMRGYAKFLLYSTADNGSLNLRYAKNGYSAGRSWEALQYPGQAALALVDFNAVEPDSKWIDTAVRIMKNVVTVRDKYKDTKSLYTDAWFVEAVLQLYPLISVDHPDDLKMLMEHAERIGNGVKEDMWREERHKAWLGGIRRPPEPKYTAHGALIMLSLAELASLRGEDNADYLRLAGALNRNVVRWQYTQITAMFFKHPDKAIGAWPESAYEATIDIDAIGPCIESLLWQKRILEKSTK